MQKAAWEFELPLELLREAVARSNLLPGQYARYRPLLADGLRFFLEHLSPGRLRAILKEQGQLPSRCTAAARVVRLLQRSPALHKLGQVVARERRLHPAFRKRLQRLESMPPSLSAAQTVRLLDKALSGWRKAGIELGAEPLAEGSVAVVVPFVWPRRRRGSREGVFKLLKPSIEALLEEDLSILRLLGSFLDEDCTRYGLPGLAYRETFDTVRQLLVHEVRLEEEQRHLAEAGREFHAQDSVAIPALFPFCSNRVTAMERLRGTKLTEAALAGRSAPRVIARQTAEALVAGPLFSARAEALFHADPHGGNLLLTPQGRVGILDWSLVGRLPKAEREQFVRLLLGALALDVEAMAKAVERLAMNQPAGPELKAVLEESLRALRWGTAPGLAWLTWLLDQLVWRAGVRLPGHLLLFRKSLLTLEGVLADLLRTDVVAAWALLDEAVLGSFLGHWQREWPQRVRAPLAARGMRTHLAGSDILSVLWLMPLTALRAWTQTGLEAVQAASRVMISTTGASLAGVASEKAR